MKGSIVFGKVTALFAALAFVVLAAACDSGGGGSSGGSAASGGGPASPATVAVRSGSWRGSGNTGSGAVVSWDVTVSGQRITQVRRGGAALNASGPIVFDRNVSSGSIYSFTLSDGTFGGFFIDDTGEYAVFVTEIGDFGVLELNATAVAGRFSFSEIYTRTATETGIIVDTDDDLDIEFAGSATVTVGSLGSTAAVFSGSDSSGTRFSGTFDRLVSTVLGGWQGSFSNSAGESGTVVAFLSPDRRFIGVWACASGNSWPNCSYLALE